MFNFDDVIDEVVDASGGQDVPGQKLSGPISLAGSQKSDGRTEGVESDEASLPDHSDRDETRTSVHERSTTPVAAAAAGD